MKGVFRRSRLFLISLLFVFVTCVDDEDPEDYAQQYGMSPPFTQVVVPGSADSTSNNRSIPVRNDYDTQVWEVRNQWTDRDTPEAKKSGIAWGENSGLSWEEKFVKWVESLPKIESHDGRYETFELVTPYGKRLPAPVLECAETALFLRATFASWYGLPFFMEATDSRGRRIFLGHFGFRTQDGRYGQTPLFKTAYRDYSNQWREGSPWPKDQELRRKGLYSRYNPDDYVPFIEPGARMGAYFDEIFLNKRVGHFMILLLSYFGSINLADSANTYQVKAASIREGDFLLERTDRTGIGHTIVVKEVEALGDKLKVEVVSGSMPRRQPVWEDEVGARYYLTNDYFTGRITATYGGGLKRFRVPMNINGYWVNMVIPEDQDDWIDSSNIDALANRKNEFEQILVGGDPQQLINLYLEIIESARSYLRDHPSSCSARIRREEAFKQLYALFAQYRGMTKEQVDRMYRTLEDYVFAELIYNESKTCCWNSTTRAMYEIIMDYNQSRIENWRDGVCEQPVVFKAVNGGYTQFKNYAESIGRGREWREWSEDEPCPQRNVQNDQEAEHIWSQFCSIYDSILGNNNNSNNCEGDNNNTYQDAVLVTPGVYNGLTICSATDEDWFKVEIPSATRLRVTISFSNSLGDLDLYLYDMNLNMIASSTSTSDVETIELNLTSGIYYIKVIGYNGAINSYSLEISY